MKTPSHLGRLRVLCLEDSLVDADLVRRTLTDAGYDLEMDLVTGRADFEALLGGDYDVILADFSLPDFDAHGALELASRACPATPFICVSGSIGEEATVELLKQGADDCVLKGRLARLPFAVQRAIDDGRRKTQLHESEERYRQLFEGESDAVFLVDNESGAILEANIAAAAMYGYSKEELFGLVDTDLSAEPDLTLAVTGRAAAEGEAVAIPMISHRRKDGSVFPVEITGRSFTLQDRMVRIAAVRDVTEKAEAAEELRRRAEQLRRTVEGAVLAMSRMVESRDPYTAGHERRVAELVTAIAVEMGMEADRVDALRIAATIHDLGKIAVPAEILSKPGRLSETEFSLIKAHSTSGFDALADIDFGAPVAEMVLQHHERLDGLGYPRGLGSDDILPEARILAVADVVEAMSSHRPYRAALGMEAALAEVRAHAGVKFDSGVVAACVRVVEEQGFQFTS